MKFLPEDSRKRIVRMQERFDRILGGSSPRASPAASSISPTRISRASPSAA
jgi:hypothetical protein